MEFDFQAQELNDVVEQNNSAIMNILSARGKQAYFPRHGILAQTQAAKNCKINATIGVALEEDKSISTLPCLANLTQLKEGQGFQYAPPMGLDELRAIWLHKLYEKNPTLSNIKISTPIVTSALTHAIYVAAQMFLEEGNKVILSDFFWENYDLVLCRSTGAEKSVFATFTDDGKYNLDGLKATLAAEPVGKKVLIRNFPNNPTGYTPTIEEAGKIKEILVQEAQRGSNIVVIVDDAYFGLVFEDGIFQESIFALLANAHESILAIKIDGPTKEDYAWGLRTGFLTFGIKGGNAQLYNALEEKAAGFIREQISSASKMSQSLLLEAYKDPNYAAQKVVKYELLKKRYDKIRQILSENADYANYFTALPFNSGYFMCIKPKKGVSAEDLRVKLAQKYSIGLIQLQGLLRIAFSSTPTSELPVVFESIYLSAKELANELA